MLYFLSSVAPSHVRIGEHNSLTPNTVTRRTTGICGNVESYAFPVNVKGTVTATTVNPDGSRSQETFQPFFYSVFVVCGEFFIVNKPTVSLHMFGRYFISQNIAFAKNL